MFTILCCFLTLLRFSSAHFSIVYPYWRGDSYRTQWERPCGGVNQSVSDTNRTEWPLDGGAVVFKGSHQWAYTFVNLGLGGDNTTNFNITLVEGFNQTGNGTFCFPKITLPSELGISEGTNASIQVIQVNEHGASLYNCADITFSGVPQTLGSDVCFNSTGVGGSPLTSEAAVNSSSGGTSSSSGSASTPTGTGARFKVVTGLMMLLLPASLVYQLM